jgi:hypothetical protein
MSNDRRALAFVIVFILIAAAVSFFKERIADAFYPAPPLQHAMDDFGLIMDGEVQPGGEATPANFDRLRVGMRRHEVRSILGTPNNLGGEGLEVLHNEHWHQEEFSIHVRYGETLDFAMIEFKSGKSTVIGK